MLFGYSLFANTNHTMLRANNDTLLTNPNDNNIGDDHMGHGVMVLIIFAMMYFICCDLNVRSTRIENLHRINSLPDASLQQRLLRQQRLSTIEEEDLDLTNENMEVPESISIRPPSP